MFIVLDSCENALNVETYTFPNIHFTKSLPEITPDDTN